MTENSGKQVSEARQAGTGRALGVEPDEGRAARHQRVPQHTDEYWVD
ncbi:MAG: hypothetical protein HYV07_04260 [Deltaproteobacteria bacterium]|nr:hypothetical protein [Deltaproteobacteria bacterium]